MVLDEFGEVGGLCLYIEFVVFGEGGVSVGGGKMGEAEFGGAESGHAEGALLGDQ